MFKFTDQEIEAFLTELQKKLISYKAFTSRADAFYEEFKEERSKRSNFSPVHVDSLKALTMLIERAHQDAVYIVEGIDEFLTAHTQ